jgi:hypothetical protein
LNPSLVESHLKGPNHLDLVISWTRTSRGPVLLQPQRSQEDIPYHFKKGMVYQFKMVWYVLMQPLRPEQNRPARRTGPTDRTPLTKFSVIFFVKCNVLLPNLKHLKQNSLKLCQNLIIIVSCSRILAKSLLPQLAIAATR